MKLANGDCVVVIRRGGVVTVLADDCPHQSLPLSAGTLQPDGTVECPFHGAKFDVQTGACIRGPATDAVATYAVTTDAAAIIIGSRLSP